MAALQSCRVLMALSQPVMAMSFKACKEGVVS